MIGAGASGLAATSKLIENGFENVKILEASDRIGGRVQSSLYFENHGYIELGAQYIHGQGGNVAYELANNGGLTNVSKTEEDFIALFSYENEGYLDEVNIYELFIMFGELMELVLLEEENQSVGEIVNNIFDIVAKE